MTNTRNPSIHGPSEDPFSRRAVPAETVPRLSTFLANLAER
eukprot:CAMPEP_0198434718 /NCGR_PEP_ID=MMETSP1452-20131203/34105_1 /TAXON_ID=1181717 /ORGANISM="Synchroma pusillum, Strain CCMP3072" /LENGTH=40 /DNA_ID= /DNA_START= /DNA_END= /DNA_ORIENTATION=